MSIMPEGGWGVVPPENDESGSHSIRGTESIHTTQFDRPRRAGLICKVCDTGMLIHKSLFRMSGPAVVIGVILLIPSVCGMVCSALMFFGVVAATSVAPLSQHRTQSAFDTEFRRSCATSFLQRDQYSASDPLSKPVIEGICECALSEIKQGASKSVAAQVCADRSLDGTLGTVGRDVDQLYSRVNSSNSTDEDAGPFRAFIGLIGGISAIALFIASFVGGLLGWLLVMKKRVLQCDICGAVVNAS